MKNRKMSFTFAACAAVILCALGASAAQVTADQAAKVACAWAVREGCSYALALRTTQFATTNAANYFAVNIQGGGTVVTTGDTTQEPVVLVSGETVDLTALDRRSPLWHLLNGDATARAGASVVQAKKATLAFASKAALAAGLQADENRANEEKWAALTSEGEDLAAAPVLRVGRAFGTSWVYQPYTIASGLSDVRVSPLCKTKWSQSTAQNLATYNYYTPNGSDPAAFVQGAASNIVCGCVATAMAQVMRYFEWPKKSVDKVTRECSWNDEPMDLTMQGGTYDWANMPLKPDSVVSLTQAQRQKIGKITSDAGISVYMGYNTENSGESGAYSYDVGVAFRDVFGYAGATYFSDHYGMICGQTDPQQFTPVRAEALQRSIYSNLDAGLPMVMGLTGHEVVADGYGYSADGLDYVHINMGWAGQCDYWYCLPAVKYNSDTYGGYMIFNDLTYNIFTNATAKSAVISGRIFDDDGEPVEGAVVRFYRTSDGSLQATTLSKAKGVYGCVVPVGSSAVSYTVEATGNGLVMETTVTVKAPVTQDVYWNYGYAGYHGPIPTVFTSDPTHLGNSWGNDIELSLPTVRIRGGAIYSRLDKALMAAKDGDTLEILLPTDLKKPVTLTNSCTIVSTNADPTATLVTRRNGAAITVATGATLTLSNVVFATDAVQPTIGVETNATLKIAGTLGLGTVQTADEGGLDLCGSLALADGYDVSVDSPYRAKDEVFGTFSCGDTTASEVASLISNAHDMDLAALAVSGTGKLKWDIVSIPVDSAKVVIDIGAGPAGYRTFAAALRAIGDQAAKIMIQHDVTHTNTYALRNDLILTSTNSAVLSFSKDAGFVVGSGTDMTLTNVTVSGAGAALTNCAFLVTGGDLTLQSGATLTSFTDSDYYKTKRDGGAIVVLSGAVTMQSGSLIANCAAHAGGNGGAIFVGSKTATANLFGGTIAGCSASYGGAVYAWGNATTGATVNVAGDFTATANTCSDNTSGNLYLMPKAVFTLTDTLTGDVGVQTGKNKAMNNLGVNFIAIGSGVSAEDATSSAPHFSNEYDTSADLVGSYDESSQTIVWVERPDESGTCDPSVANVFVQDADGTRPYLDLNTAFAYEKGDATFLVKTNATLVADVAIASQIVITRHPDSVVNPKIWRMSDAMYCVQSGGSLALTNVTLYGVSSGELAKTTSKSKKGLISVSGGTLTLGPGALVGVVRGNASRASNAISVSGGGTLTMESGSVVSNSCNSWAGLGDGTGVGGGILLDNATAYFRGGTVAHCSSYRAGGVYVANKSKAYVSGDFTVTNNTETTGLTNDNLVVAKDASLVLADELTGSVGVHEGIASDTNAFATVEGAWTSVESMKTSAARFFHDRRGAHGSVVTNGTGNAALVWDDTLTHAGGFTIGGDSYRVFLAAGQAVAVPKAFSVAPKTTSTGAMSLALEGVEEGCWYTVYSTSDLSKPFTVEKSVQLKKGETFEFDVDTTAGSKFYKVVAEEGLK